MLEHRLLELKLIKNNSCNGTLLLFFAWLFDNRAEHNLYNIPLYLFLKEFLNINIMAFEINSKILLRKNTIKIFYINKESFIFHINKEFQVNVRHRKKTELLSKKRLSLFIKQIYTITSGYQGRKIIRIIYNETKAFKDIIFDKSYISTKCKNKINKSDEDIVKFLLKTHEIVEYKQLAIKQQTQSICYGSIFNKHSFDIFAYKLNRYKQVKPQVISIGSSRAHFFKQSNFRQKFYNCSYTMTYLQEGKRFIQNIIKDAKPKFMIIMMEFWWFHPNHYNETPFLPLHDEKYHFDVDYINKIYEYIYHNNLNIENINEKNNYSTLKNYGIRAMELSEGYLNDGYYFYSKGILDGHNLQDRKNKLCKKYIQNNEFHFQSSKIVAYDKIVLFFDILKLLQTHNIQYVIAMPPVSKKTFKMLSKNDFKYIKKIDNIFKADPNYFNFLNPDKINAKKCEFYDCYHGGDIIYMRLLKYLYKIHKPIRKYLDIETIRQDIDENKNKIIKKNNYLLKSEINFENCK